MNDELQKLARRMVDPEYRKLMRDVQRVTDFLQTTPDSDPRRARVLALLETARRRRDEQHGH